MPQINGVDTHRDESNCEQKNLAKESGERTSPRRWLVLLASGVVKAWRLFAAWAQTPRGVATITFAGTLLACAAKGAATSLGQLLMKRLCGE